MIFTFPAMAGVVVMVDAVAMADVAVAADAGAAREAEVAHAAHNVPAPACNDLVCGDTFYKLSPAS